MNNITRSKNNGAYKFIAPFLLVFFAVNLFPYFISFYTSLHEWDMSYRFIDENLTYTGLKNYGLFHIDKYFFPTLLNIVVFALCSVVLIHCLSIIVAKLILLSSKKAQGLILIAYVVPYVVNKDALVIGAQEYGIGLTIIESRWWGPIVNGVNESFIATYQFIGFFTLIYYMVLKSIKRNLIEAAQLEGANVWDIFINIEFPYLKNMLYMMIVLSVIMLIQVAQGFKFIIGNLFWMREIDIASAFSWVYIFFVMALFIKISIVRKLIIKRKEKSL
ncbi:MAG: sugar ABC transporter permease [Saccharospirillaceae bacterium]|nr:sugar ABC transporter permease [Pseudomonadales bacterium]NRB78432.1 sugar ABC transporter permease [Saccharospirillaceae bacterium]